MRTSASTISVGIRSPEMSKLPMERCVCAPHSRSAGTSIGPKVSRSTRVGRDSDEGGDGMGGPGRGRGASARRGRFNSAPRRSWIDQAERRSARVLGTNDSTPIGPFA